ncbi:CLUMA_CG005943, isoform A [Clunio marinus]|uniref:CLUMA_CG005943, isoform A n=1 Tax=Clunio marinus TaxID=568069 RepID=A0A1J1I0J0_9DIPT|nr:CLUMA_CG005943, isoform A [Clunio marinus]
MPTHSSHYTIVSLEAIWNKHQTQLFGNRKRSNLDTLGMRRCFTDMKFMTKSFNNIIESQTYLPHFNSMPITTTRNQNTDQIEFFSTLLECKLEDGVTWSLPPGCINQQSFSQSNNIDKLKISLSN